MRLFGIELRERTIVFCFMLLPEASGSEDDEGEELVVVSVTIRDFLAGSWRDLL